MNIIITTMKIGTVVTGSPASLHLNPLQPMCIVVPWKSSAATHHCLTRTNTEAIRIGRDLMMTDHTFPSMTKNQSWITLLSMRTRIVEKSNK
eukprot:14709.XXX_441093_441368_1 [CDS] Oithona nana genome sequencing.